MISATKLRLFPFNTNHITVPINDDKSYNVIFMSENSDLFSAYSALGIRPIFVKKITAVPFTIPRLVATTSTLTPYKSLGLFPIMDPKGMNAFIDANPFIKLLDNTYGKGSYKRPIVLSKLLGYLNECKNVGDNRKNILIYHVNLNKPIPADIVMRRGMALIMTARLGEGSFPFDVVLLAIQRGGNMKYMSIYNKDIGKLSAGKITSIIRQLSPEKDISTIDPEPTDEEEVPVNDTPYEEKRTMKHDGYEIVSEALSDKAKKRLKTAGKVVGTAGAVGATAYGIAKGRKKLAALKQAKKIAKQNGQWEKVQKGIEAAIDKTNKEFFK